MRILLSLIGVLSLSGCMVQGLSQCDPLDPSRCGLPFPNNFFLRPSLKAGGALRLQLTNVTFPLDNTGKPIRPEEGGWNELDGFSTLMPIMTFFPTTKGSVSLSNTPPYWNIAHSLEDNCSTILLDTKTGKKVPHWVELDHSSDGIFNKSYDRMFIVWPAMKLKHDRRYIVAMRHLVDDGGNTITPSTGFQSLRDGLPSNNTDIEERRSLFKDIFSQLNKVGFTQSELQLSWDFTTGSLTSVTHRMLHIRDDGFSRLPTDGPDFQVKSVKNNVNPLIARQIEVLIQVPQYVDKQAPGATLVIDPKSGLPVYQKMASAEISIRIPPAVAAGKFSAKETAAVQYGHGLFGTRNEANNNYIMQQADRHGYVILSSDWIGMGELDAPVIALMLNSDLTRFGMVPDRSQQGWLRALVAMRLMMSAKFLSSNAMKFAAPILSTSSPRYYFGNSNGGVFGTCYMALSTDVKRGMLGVGGAPYTQLLPRSSDFAPLFDDLKLRYPSPLDRQLIFPLIQLLWDRAEPVGYMGSITSSPLPNTPSHEVLLQHGLGDAQVSYVGAYTLGRSIGTSIFESNVHEKGEKLWGFPVISDKELGHTAMLVTWVFPNVPPSPEINIPASAADTHEGPRRQTNAQEMMYHFFQTGAIKNTCQGPCHGVHNYTVLNN